MLLEIGLMAVVMWVLSFLISLGGSYILMWLAFGEAAGEMIDYEKTVFLCAIPVVNIVYMLTGVWLFTKSKLAVRFGPTPSLPDFKNVPRVEVSSPQEPWIQWTHIDGPLFHGSLGGLHWLTPYERFQWKMKKLTIEQLDEKCRS